MLNDIITGDVPAKRMRSCKNGAVVVGRSRLGWNEMIVLPFLFRIRCTERRSNTRRRLSTDCSTMSIKAREFSVGHILEYKNSGACGSIICVPSRVRVLLSDVADLLLGAELRCCASWSDIDRRKVSVMVMSVPEAK